ncbi:MAG: flagellar hook-associated protein FlgL [Tepidisphaeraceae bacterium]
MAILPVSLARVSNQLRTNVSLNQIQSTQAKLLNVQNQLTTGRKLNAPSDNPGDASIAAELRKSLEKRTSFSANLDASKNTLSAVDTTLGDVSGLLQQAQTLAQANVGDDVTQDARNAAADQLDSIYSQLVDLGNKSFEGSYLFAGDKLDQPPFIVGDGGGMQFVGSENTLSNQVDESTDANFQVDGAKVWGALSTRIESSTTLTPSVSSTTRLADLGGTADKGVRAGMIAISDGTTTKNVDLSSADTLGDVIDRINAAGFTSVTASITAGGGGLTISGGAGDTLTVNDVAGGTMAADLGIKATTSPGAGTPVVGAEPHAKISNLTPLSALNGGAGIDTSGFKITNGGASATIDLSSANTVEDLLNAVNGSNTGVRMEINDDGSGLKLLNTTQGTDLSVSENGGTTAAELGLRSYSPTSPLSELNNGDGVSIVDGNDFTITDSTGVTFSVDLDTDDTTVQDVLDKINAAATTAGAGVTAGFATTGNGITLTDSAGGGASLKIVSANNSTALEDLGLDVPASGGVITGKDVNPVTAQGVFANIDALRAAMRSGDKLAITKAAESLQSDYDRVVRSRGEVGARVQAVESRQTRLEDQNVSTQALLSKLEDTDFTQAATEYSLLQTSLQAALQTTATIQNLSLMDFIK